MTDDSLIAALLEREGGYVDRQSDRGGPTNFGITATTLGAWRRLGRPATRAEVRALPVAEARDIYAAIYVRPFAWVGDEPLRAHLVDFAVSSSVLTAIRQLQRVLGVTIDGVAGPRTRAALIAHDPRLVNNALVGARVHYLETIVDGDASQIDHLHGWVRRAVGFFA